MTAAALAFVIQYGPSFPRWDDFAILRALLGDQPISLGWLWSQHNEHRVFLPRLALLALLRLGGSDFRAAMVFNVVVLSSLSLGLMLTSRSCRGGWSTSDAVFPLGLLHLGHQANLLWGWQVQFILSTFLAGAVLLWIVRDSSLTRPSTILVLVLSVFGLPLCGANGLAFVPGLAGWLILDAIRPGSERGRGRLVKAGIALLAIGWVLFYFAGYRSAGHQSVRADLGSRLKTTSQFLSLALGPAGADLWPYSSAVVIGLIIASVALIARVVLVRPQERSRALGLLSMLGGNLILAFGLGWGRAGAGEAAGFEPRYVTLAAPLVCILALVWSLYGGATLSKLVPTGLASLMLGLLWPNDQAGLAAGRDLASQAARLEGEVRNGEPTYLVIKHFSKLLHPSEDELNAMIPRLRESGLGIFRQLRPNPTFREVEVPVVPVDIRGADWHGGGARVTGVDSRITFDVPGEPFVAGVRLNYSHANADRTPARFQFDWRRTGIAPDPARHRYSNWNLPTGPGRTTTIWVGERLSQIAIQPDNRPCDFRLSSITLLIPPG